MRLAFRFIWWLWCIPWLIVIITLRCLLIACYTAVDADFARDHEIDLLKEDVCS